MWDPLGSPGSPGFPWAPLDWGHWNGASGVVKGAKPLAPLKGANPLAPFKSTKLLASSNVSAPLKSARGKTHWGPPREPLDPGPDIGKIVCVLPFTFRGLRPPLGVPRVPWELRGAAKERQEPQEAPGRPCGR